MTRAPAALAVLALAWACSQPALAPAPLGDAGVEVPTSAADDLAWAGSDAGADLGQDAATPPVDGADPGEVAQADSDQPIAEIADSVADLFAGELMDVTDLSVSDVEDEVDLPEAATSDPDGGTDQAGDLGEATDLAQDAGDPAGDAAKDDSDGGGADGDAAGDAADATATNLPGDVTCDAGDENWVRRALPLLSGRKPKGIGEVRALAQMVAVVGRAQVAKAMTLQPTYRVRWIEHLFDLMHVGRAPPEALPACTLSGAAGSDGGIYAAQVRDNAPNAPAAPTDHTLRDLANSALDLDDLSPLLRANLFQLLAAPSPYCSNTPPLDMELARRSVFGERFGVAYLGRNLGCLGCHNSAWGVGDHPDPALDHHWPIAGQFELALFGADTGRPPPEVHALFRYQGVIGKAAVQNATEKGKLPDDPVPAIRPWGWSAKCGEFVPGGAIGPDPAAIQAWFGGKLTAPASVWYLEDLLRKGMVAIAKAKPVPPPELLAQQPATAFAWLVAARVADSVWQAAMGARLQQSHGFARNAAQRDRLLALTKTLLSDNWSLRALLVQIATDPLFNPAAPQAGCGSTAYPWPLVLDPFANDTPDKALHGNGPGDALHRERGTVLANLALIALDRTPLPPQLELPPKSGQWMASAMLNEDLGAFVSDSAQGFGDVTYSFLAVWNMLLKLLPKGAAPVSSSSGLDWLGQLQAATANNPQISLRAVVVAIADRLWSAPDLDPALEPAIAAHFGAPTLDVPIASLASFEANCASFADLAIGDMLFYATPLALPGQKAQPTLTVGDGSFGAACSAWASLVFDPAKWNVTCGMGKVTVLPAKP